MAQLQCRFCTKLYARKHCYELFTKQGLAHNFPARLSKLLELAVEENSYMSSFMCRTCKTGMLSLEEKLEGFRRSARAYSMEAHAAASNPSNKRTKETGGCVDVSPHIEKARPPLKRCRRRELFPITEGKCTAHNYTCGQKLTLVVLWYLYSACNYSSCFYS